MINMKTKKIFVSLIILFNLIYIPNVNASSINQNTVNDAILSLNITAPSAILIEKKSGDILYQREAYTPMYPASTVKIMTAIIVFENCDLDEPVTVSQNAISSVPYSYTVADLQAGEILSVQDLLYAMLIPSGNDAANALAEYVGGNIQNFAAMMNKKAIELGCKNTNFTNPNGVHDANMHTTAYDLSLIAKYAMDIDEFRTIVSTPVYTLPSTNIYPNSDRVFKNSNHLIHPDSPHYYEYATGIKTGYTNPAQNCLVAGAMKDNVEFICVILGSTANNVTEQSKFSDAKTLFEFGYTYYYKYYNEKNNRNILANILNIENYVKPELIVDENNNAQWGYIFYLIAKTTLILISIIYVLYYLIKKIKKYLYNRSHAKYNYKY